jgi:hypothetical protein
MMRQPIIKYEPDPLTLLENQSQFTAHIEYLFGYNISNIDPTSLELNSTLTIMQGSNITGDYDNDNVADLTVQFNGTEVVRFIRDEKGITHGIVTLGLSGCLYNGTSIQGNSLIYVRMSGDVNCDGRVNVFDLLDLGKAFGSDYGSPNWNIYCDFNNDHAVDASDLHDLSKNYGKTSP